MSAPAATWPAAPLDAVARLRAIAAALPHVAWVERAIDAPFDVVWSILGDLERGVPRFDHYVRAIRITARDGERLRLTSTGPLGLAMRFEAVYRPGWCVMRSRLGDVGMAAAPDGPARTRIGHYEGSRWLGALGRCWFARTLPSEIDALERLCGLPPALTSTRARGERPRSAEPDGPKPGP